MGCSTWRTSEASTAPSSTAGASRSRRSSVRAASWRSGRDEPVELELDLEPAVPPKGKTANKKSGGKGPPAVPAKAKEREEPKPARPSEDSGPIVPDFDFDAPWEMPPGGDLRDLLEQM